ncbi:MAG: hypothetical protein RIQ33_1536 [Bacteroidota bacterium]|jgi:hypothetical protein
MKRTIITSLLVIFTAGAFAFSNKIKNAKSETFTVYGNCDQCKARIEKTVYKKGKSIGNWNVDSKKLTLTFDSIKINRNILLKKIAYAGHDNDMYMAPDEAYNKLDGCCQYKRMYLKEATPPKDTKAEPQKEEIKIISTKTDNSLAAVYSAYFFLKDALIKDDGNNASIQAKELFKAVDAVKMEIMNPSEHDIWMKNVQAISYNAEHIKSTTDNEHQREHFAKLSIAMIEVMKIIKPNFIFYIDHCPMYNGGKGADWLSKDAAIKNPYYGSQMLTCGRVKETVK